MCEILFQVIVHVPLSMCKCSARHLHAEWAKISETGNNAQKSLKKAEEVGRNSRNSRKFPEIIEKDSRSG